ncbi:RidA family protein [Alcaligenaceae bacterium]|nr:RidA family protein [Alcaligenaceae bacterium]
MSKKIRVTSPHVSEPPAGLWSNCLQVDDTLYISGLTARAPDDSIPETAYEQAKTIFQKMKYLIEAAGGKMNDMVTLTIFVTRISDNTEIWRARKEFFSGDFPACALIEVKGLAKPELLVEIQGQARLGAGG